MKIYISKPIISKCNKKIKIINPNGITIVLPEHYMIEKYVRRGFEIQKQILIYNPLTKMFVRPDLFTSEM